MALAGPIFLPALRGKFGDWVYFSAIMPLSEVKARVRFAHELHRNERLGELIQRHLQDSGSGKSSRAGEIASYLQKNENRFFNAIVVGIYGGEPVWHPFDIRARTEFDRANIADLAEQDRIGLLELNGTEQLFAVDGQHRVAGIKRALATCEKLDQEILSVLFVPHLNSETGLQRTRRLFVDLNKHATPVGTKDTIILDVVDLPAILARRLVDEHRWFSRGQVDINRFSSTIPRNSNALFSIATLYSVIKFVLPKALTSNRRERDEIKQASSVRLTEERIDHYFQRAIVYFEGLANIDPQLGEYLEGGPESGIAEIARNSENRNVLFRPVGQIVFAKVIAGLACKDGLNSALTTARSFPIDMALPPYAHVIWNPEQQKVISKGAGLAVRLLQFMCGLDSHTDKLRKDYSLAVQKEDAKLPKFG